MMERYLMDTSAILALWDDEPGADTVAGLLAQAQEGRIEIDGCFITLMEVLYRVWKDEGESAGRQAYTLCKALPITWIHESSALLEKAAWVKANHRVSLADAWIAACGLLRDATLVHKDPEFLPLKITQLPLPFKAPLGRSATKTQGEPQ